MNRIFYIAVLFILSMNLNAQDLVVTSKNDSINAQITKVKREMIYFRFMKDNELRSTLLPLTDVKTYQKGFYGVAEVPANAKKASEYDGTKVRIGIQAGFAFRTAKIPNGLDRLAQSYARDLKSGLNWGLDAHYFISEPTAFGIKFNSFYSTGTEDNLQATFPDGSTEIGFKNEVYINFIGPSVLTRFVSTNEKNAFITGFALGYMSYKNEETVGQRFFTSTGSTVGLALDFGYDIGLSDKISLGFLASWTTGVINKVEIEEAGGPTVTVDLEETLGEKESLSRVNISAGLRFYL